MGKEAATGAEREPLFSHLLESAARLAARGHFHQFRKRGRPDEPCEPERTPLEEDCIPYVTHLLGVVGILRRLGADEKVLAAALLHDYIEDVPDADGRKTIERAVGGDVLALVLEVTEDKRNDLDARRTWEARKRTQIEKVARMSSGAVLIKAADLLHNLGSMVYDLGRASDPTFVWNRFNAPPQRQIWYFRSLTAELGQRLGSDHTLYRELEEMIARMSDMLPVA